MGCLWILQGSRSIRREISQYNMPKRSKDGVSNVLLFVSSAQTVQKGGRKGESEQMRPWKLGKCVLLLWALTYADAALDMGARLLPGGMGARFKVWAPHGSLVKVELKKAEAASVEETIELAKGDNCIWYGDAPSAAAGDHYRFVLDSSWNDCFDTEGATLYRRDPYARYAMPEVELRYVQYTPYRVELYHVSSHKHQPTNSFQQTKPLKSPHF